MSSRPSAGTGNLGCNCSCIFFVDIENTNYGTIRGKLKRDSATDTTPAAGDNCGLAVESEVAGAACRLGQSEIPRFQGIKSSWFFSSALVRTSPLATRIT